MIANLSIPAHSPRGASGAPRTAIETLNLELSIRYGLLAHPISCRRPFCDASRQMAQRNVEIVIGRLVTDEAFRAMFLRDPAATLTQFVERGYELTSLEIAALEATDPDLWARTGEQIDPRLQKVSSGLL